mmetsp:Transcript_31329/g.73853  ORF Transcript_31329/g.73853 Transcript_31329/m.73853 type:complete len:118 (+) Transcript_31329:72-425(+)
MGVKIDQIRPGKKDTKPQKDDIVSIHLVLKLMDGVIVSDSREQDSDLGGEPLRFFVGRGNVIRGLDEALPRISLGEIVRMIVSPDFGYGSKGFHPSVPPNATLLLEVELLEINGAIP